MEPDFSQHPSIISIFNYLSNIKSSQASILTLSGIWNAEKTGELEN
jgi:hemoglobin-like flavoprotein